MKVIVAPDKFKGSCPADRVAAAIAQGWKSIFPQDETVLVPLADGGEGMLDAMCAACGGEIRTAAVRGPLGSSVDAKWLLLADGGAVVEMAQASGLVLVKEQDRNVRKADTFGTGELIRAALDAGCRRLIVGIGGSATNDGGMGMLRALGASFLGAAGEIIEPGNLDKLIRVDFSGFDTRVAQCSFTVACDVANPLIGPEGASVVFGPQKGASPEDVTHMDSCLRRLSDVVAAAMGCDRSKDPGAGAAGGLGWSLTQCCGARMRPGIDIVLDAAGFEEALDGAGLVITGEGSLDGQSAMGKTPVGVAARARKRGVPVAAIAGTLGRGHEAVYDMGIDCAAGIAPGPMPLEDAMGRAEELIWQASARLARAIRLGQAMGVRL